MIKFSRSIRIALILVMTVFVAAAANTYANEAYWMDVATGMRVSQLSLPLNEQKILRLKAEVPDNETLKAYKFTLYYDETVISVNSVEKTAGAAFPPTNINTNTPGKIIINAFDVYGVEGFAVLSLIDVTITGIADGDSAFTIEVNNFGEEPTNEFLPTPVNLSAHVSSQDTTPTATIVFPTSAMAIQEGESVFFEGQSMYGEAPFVYFWDFNGGASNSNSIMPGAVTFHSAGSYEVEFAVTDADGDKDTDSVIITVSEAPTDTIPTAVIDAPVSDVTITEGESVDFMGSVTGGNAPFRYDWDFGGGAASANVEDPGSVTFSTHGIYTVVFTVTDSDGDASSSNPITVTVNQAQSNTKPIAAITSPSADVIINEGESVDFQGKVTNGNAPFGYFWDFDGGADNKTVEDPGNTTFLTQGTYDVLFTVTDNDGESSSDTVRVIVKYVEDDTMPQAGIASPAAQQIIVNENESVNFQGVVTSGNAPFTYAWDFGGGAANVNVEDPGNVTFTTQGVYTVTFTVTDKDGDTASDSVQIMVQKIVGDLDVTMESPAANVTINVGEAVNFEAFVIGGTTPYQYLWDFAGVIQNMTVEDPGLVVFNDAGTYVITITVTDSSGNSTSASTTITVKAAAGGSGGGGGGCFISDTASSLF